MINKQFVLDVLKTVSNTETKKGKQKTEENIKNINEKLDIKLFYDNCFSKLTNIKPSYTNKTFIIKETSEEMIRCITTNISTHFIKHLFRYINEIFKNPQIKIIKQEKDKEIRKELYKQLNQDIRNLKSDLINNKIKDSKKEYHNWINENKKHLFPEKITKSVAYDVKVNPEKYIKYSIYINKKIEEITKTIINKNNEIKIINSKPYQFIPLRNNITPKHITINTPALIDIPEIANMKINNKNLFSYGKSEMVLHTKKHQKHIWSKILKLEKNSIFKDKNYIFYNQISTDGFSCSLLFILKKYKNKVFGDKLPKVNNEIDFTKLEDCSKEEYNEFLTDKYKLVSLDPGKIRPITMIDEKNNVYKYSACRRRFETYTKRSNYIINQEKIKHNIISKETELSKFSSKTLKIENFKNFIINKNKLNTKVNGFYKKILLRKLAFRRYIRTKQSEVKLLNEIENKYLTKNEQINGKKILILHGDYSRTSQMKGCISTPNIGIKKLLLSRFDILEVNEYNTSQLYNKTFTKMENLKIRKKKHIKHLHEILTLKEEHERRIYVNRDVNACKNILYLGKTYLINQTRPNEFKPKIIKKKKPNSCLIKK
jgi:hypothetical protein